MHSSYEQKFFYCSNVSKTGNKNHKQQIKIIIRYFWLYNRFKVSANRIYLEIHLCMHVYIWYLFKLDVWVIYEELL